MTRTIRLPESSYALLSVKTQRRGLDPDTLADDLVRTHLAAQGEQNLEATLKSLAELHRRPAGVGGRRTRL